MGRRFGAPKQFLELSGRPVVAWSLEAARSVADAVVVVVPSASGGSGTGSVDAPTLDAEFVVPGGQTRADSVRAGLSTVPEDAAIVVVHDGARPLASPRLFAAVVDAVRRGADGAIPVLPVGDTVKLVRSGEVVATLARDGLVTVQTPQAFDAEVLRRAHESAPQATDDAALVERLGASVRVVDGDPRNVKITYPGDLELAAAAAGSVAGRADV